MPTLIQAGVKLPYTDSLKTHYNPRKVPMTIVPTARNLRTDASPPCLGCSASPLPYGFCSWSRAAPGTFLLLGWPMTWVVSKSLGRCQLLVQV